MNIVLRWYNKNRKVFWIVTVIIIGILLIIRILNNYYKTSENKEKQKDVSIYNSPNYSVISEKIISKDVADSNVEVITNFINYCNTKDFEQAYDLLTKDCKEIFFQDIDSFKEYVNTVFQTRKLFTYQTWISKNAKYTYRVELSEDLLATGNSSSKTIECYYTVVKENNNRKLNIKDYIGSEEINKSATNYGITVTAIKKDIYIDYEEYTFSAVNNSSRKIKLDSGEYVSTMYLKTSNSNRMTSKRYEISDDDLLINYDANNIKIKYFSGYNPDIRIEKIVFNDVILNYYEYINTPNKEEYIQRGFIEIIL